MDLLAEVQEDLHADSIELASIQSWSLGWDESATRFLRMLPDPNADPDSLGAAASGSLSTSISSLFPRGIWRFERVV